MINLPDDKKIQCGYSILSTRWFDRFTPEPFISACLIHDQRYGERVGERKEWDSELLRNMLNASYSKWDKARAYLFYSLVRLVGGPVWEGK